MKKDMVASVMGSGENLNPIEVDNNSNVKMDSSKAFATSNSKDILKKPKINEIYEALNHPMSQDEIKKKLRNSMNDKFHANLISYNKEMIIQDIPRQKVFLHPYNLSHSVPDLSIIPLTPKANVLTNHYGTDKNFNFYGPINQNRFANG